MNVMIRPNVAHNIRTVWFLAAMIPVVLIATALGMTTLLLTSPLMLYATLRGKHLKNPWRKPLNVRQE